MSSSSSAKLDSKKLPVIGNRFGIIKTLGKGGFSQVFKVWDNFTNQHVALKVSLLEESEDRPFLKIEYLFLHHLGGGGPLGGFPRVSTFGKWEGRSFLAMTLLGRSLRKHVEAHQFSVPIQTVLLIMDQLLLRVEYLHQKGIIHRDIKPDNIIIGGRNQEDEHKIFLIDFGLAALYKTKDGHILPKKGCILGTPAFMSISAHSKEQQSRRDDLESLAYVAVYLLSHGTLPWGTPQMEQDERRNDKILYMKKHLTPKQIFKGQPSEFPVFLGMVQELGFEEQPQYRKYREIFRRLGTILGVNYDDPRLVWTCEK